MIIMMMDTYKPGHHPMDAGWVTMLPVEDFVANATYSYEKVLCGEKSSPNSYGYICSIS